MRIQLLLAPLLLAAAACHSRDVASAAGPDGGTLVISTPGEPSIAVPLFATTVSDMELGSTIFERLAEPGPDLNTIGDRGYTPALADKWTWGPDSLSIAFHIDPRAHWQDGAPVTARDVRFTFEAYRDPASGSIVTPLLTGIDSVSVRDPATAVFWFHRRYPQQFFDASYQMYVLPAHLLSGMQHADIRTSSFARHPIGSGPFRFSRWIAGTLVEVVADTARQRGRPRLNRIIWSVAPDYVASVTRLLAGDADFLEYLRPEAIAALRKHPEIKRLHYPSLSQGYLVFNLRDPDHAGRPNPIFGDRGVRRALTMAVDRRRLVANVFDSLGAVAIGPEVRAQSTADTTIPMLPFDPAHARALLDSLGWRDSNGDGVREKDGVPMRFTLMAPTASAIRIRTTVLLQQMFAKVGAKAELQQLEFNLFQQREQQRKFDAAINSMTFDPSPATIRQVWGSEAARDPSGANIGSYENPAFDALLDSAVNQFDPARSKALYRRAYATLIADAPAIWLYEPVNTVGVNQRVHPVGMRADGWWVNLAEWYIPADERIARDRVGLASLSP
ncbi:MAG TPA: peptide ABC transporter substrate-binding protein [Gemmatimonadaceae bacterium]|nr:peptide ABC transporter substrate-binding protein [Gemmatimonadaceae bacterium]